MAKHGKESPVNATLVGDDLAHWKGTLCGPVRKLTTNPPSRRPAVTGRAASQEGSPYEGGTFIVDIVLPDDYPFAPPKVSQQRRVFSCPSRGGAGAGGSRARRGPGGGHRGASACAAGRSDAARLRAPPG